MITSKYLLHISEEYLGAETFKYPVGGGEHNSVYLSVYKNPTSSDLRELMIAGKKSTGRVPDSIRFIANASNQNVYIADGWWSVHYMIAKVAHIPYFDNRNPGCLEGRAELRGSGKPVITDPLNDWPDMHKKRIEYKWDWLNKYFDTSKVKKLLNL